MATSSKRNYVVVTAGGETVDVAGVTRVEESVDKTLVTFYDGDEAVGSFRSFSSYRRA